MINTIACHRGALTKSSATSFRPETIVASSLYSMVLIPKCYSIMKENVTSMHLKNLFQMISTIGELIYRVRILCIWYVPNQETKTSHKNFSKNFTNDFEFQVYYVSLKITTYFLV